MIGSGTQADPYIISSKADLLLVHSNLSAYFKLAVNLDLGDSFWEPILNFAGNFDGNGKTLQNVIVSGGNLSGLFGKALATSVIKNLGVTGVSISGGLYTGALIGHNLGAVENCYATGSLYGTSQVGGLIGFQQGGTVRNSYSNVNVTGEGTSRIGGFIGRNSGTLTNCYCVGQVSNYTAGYTPGGFTGEGSSSTSCYWDTQVSGLTTSTSGLGRTTAQMKTQGTFSGWDFSSIWSINNDYPKLKVFSTTPIVNPPAVTINSISKGTISAVQDGSHQSQVEFTFNMNVVQWEVRVGGAGNGTGYLAESGGAVTAGTKITAIVDYTEGLSQGGNRVNIYGKDSNGNWTPYE